MIIVIGQCASIQKCLPLNMLNPASLSHSETKKTHIHVHSITRVMLIYTKVKSYYQYFTLSLHPFFVLVYCSIVYVSNQIRLHSSLMYFYYMLQVFAVSVNYTCACLWHAKFTPKNELNIVPCTVAKLGWSTVNYSLWTAHFS